MNSENRSQLPPISDRFEKFGFEILPAVLSDDICDDLASELTQLYECEQITSPKKIGGIRNLLRQSPQVAQIASSKLLKTFVEERIGKSAMAVRALFFDKNPEANWRVPWHQDLTIAVTEKIETVGFSAWSVKDEIPHVQPPTEILEKLVTIRIHLDSCDINNGPLKIIPGSHLNGKLDAVEIAKRTTENVFACEVPKGGALLMRPLLLHASSPAKAPLHRRVLHIEFATQNLPGNLTWFDC